MDKTKLDCQNYQNTASYGEQDDFDYNGSLYRISYLNEQIDLAQMPAFSYHGVLLARAKKVFETAGCTYIQTEDGIILSKGDITLNMSFQDKCAYVNGKKFIMEEALYLVNNKDTNVSYAFVPFEFTAKMLGFDLKYDDTEKSFELLASERTGDSSKIKELVNYHSINVPGETPEDKIPVPGETTYFSWESLPAFEAVLENSSVPVHTIADGSFSELPGSIYVYMNKKSEADGSETFMFASSDKITSVESKFTSEGTLQVIVHNATSADYGSMVVGFPLVESYKVYELPESKQVILEFSLSKDKCQYTLSLSEDKQKLSVMVYPDYLTKAEAYPAETSDILLLHGVAREDIQVVEDNGMLVFSIPTAFNSLGDKFFFNQNTSFLNYCLLNAVSDGTRITVMMKPDMNYYFSEHGNSVAIHFTDMETEEDVTYPSSSEQKPSLPDDKLLIPLPEGITKKDIKDKDNYLNTNFVISIPGNQVAFYQNHPLSNPYSVIEDYSVSYNSTTGYTNISFDTKLICGYKYDVSEGHLIVRVARPNEIYSKVVVLDAGHGGIDPGAIKNKTYEKTLNYTILNKYTKEYFDKSDIKVYFTRLTDVKIDLYKRADLAAEVGADLFISLHMNANNSSTVKGTQVFYSSDNNKKNSAGLNSYRLAKTLAANLSTSMATKNRGASTSNFVVVKYNTVPAVLVELGFMTNSSDFKKLTDTSYQKKAAETIYKTVVQIFKEYPTGR